ncbi:hypothetical protein EE612_056366 [Oryza sativa]|nr:hypothetical protein EE612_056366 [Oryza sativa]
MRALLRAASVLRRAAAPALGGGRAAPLPRTCLLSV